MKEYSYQRRKLLLDKMQALEQKQIHCFECKSGNCCTFELNSMQIIPLEAVEILAYLETRTERSDLALLLNVNIKDNGLDRLIPSNGKRSFLRRYYTCPFFSGKEKGCSLSRSVKPLGCLGFNPSQVGAIGPEHCRSDKEGLILQEQLTASCSELTNKKIIKELELDWTKLPISLALRDLLLLCPNAQWGKFLHGFLIEK